jgi:hypothetical protein
MLLIIPAIPVPWRYRQISSFACLMFEINFNNRHYKWAELATEKEIKRAQIWILIFLTVLVPISHSKH